MAGQNILLFSSDAEKIPYLLAETKKLQPSFNAEKILVLVIGQTAIQEAHKLQSIGADAIISVVTDHAFPETASSIIQKVMEKNEVNALLMLDKAFEVEIAGRLSTQIGAGCLTNCLSIKKQGENSYTAEKMLYGGVVIGNYQLNSDSIVVTLNENSCREKYDNTENKEASLIEETIEVKGLKKKKIQEQLIEQTVDLKGAKKIVSVGRGINKQEDVAMMEEFADSIDAQLGCSRPIVEDFKWLKLERQVGLTGITVAPDLYVAVGISGQIQHMVGIKDAKVIVAINNNKSAPIFEAADYGIVGDLYEVIPKLKEAMQAVNAK